jgi:hypothetical protein
MTLRTLVLVVCATIASTHSIGAQPQQPPPGRPAPQGPRITKPQSPAGGAERRTVPVAAPGQPINVKVEVTITDQRGGTQALKKTVTVVTGDGLSGFIRSEANYQNIGGVPLNLDTEPRILADNKIRLRVNLQYTLPAASSQGADTPGGPATVPGLPGAGSLRTTAIHENLAMILESGKPLVVAQSADPVGDRQVTIEVKATILR